MNDQERHNAELYADMNNEKYVKGTGTINDNYVAPISYESNSNDYGSTSGCFPSGTLISTPSGSVPIEDIVEGEIVSSISVKNGLHSSSRVLKVSNYINRRIWIIKLSNGSTIQTTAVHSFFDGSGWKKASQIKLGHYIFCESEEGLELEKVYVVGSYESDNIQNVYNIIVEKNFTFIADGAFVSSFTHFRSLHSTIWKWRCLLYRMTVLGNLNLRQVTQLDDK